MTATDPSLLSIDRRSNVVIVTIDRPDRLNALSRATLDAFGTLGRDLSRELQEPGAIRAIVITGSGDRAFCVGADLKERKSMSDDDVRAQLRMYRTELSWIDGCTVPVVAAINGLALGGGLELAMLCDLRVAAAHAELGLPETRLGIIPGAGGTQLLPHLVGEARAKEMILLGARLSAAEALAAGLIHRVAAEGTNVVEDALDWIRPIREGAPIAQSAALRAIDAARVLSRGKGLEREIELYEECLKSEDRLEALRAFAEKRKPIFGGR